MTYVVTFALGLLIGGAIVFVIHNGIEKALDNLSSDIKLAISEFKAAKEQLDWLKGKFRE